MEEIKDVSTIQDEDVLRRMWQATEDFSRKKEIRSHMYKLREARLKEFYTTGEVLKDVQRSNSSPGLRDQHPCAKVEGPTHADSLADHSFLSLKTKEIRDSESPTRDVQYRNSKNRETDGQWTITSNTSKSNDGKTITSSQLATTQGVRAIDGGQLAYAAANEHQASVFADGDDNNFTRSVGESSKTFAQQNVVSGDENNFRSSKTTSSSTSSKVVTHHSSTSGDVGEFEQLAITGKDQTDDGRHGSTVRRTVYTSEVPEERFTSKVSSNRTSENVKSSKTVYSPEEVRSSSTVTKTTYTSGEIPDDLKKSIADGNTKVYTETKTLPDGSTVTTTRYETKGSKKFSTTGSTHRQTVEQKSSDNRVNNKQVEYITGGDDDNTSRTVVTTKTIRETYEDDASPRRPTNRNDVNKTESVRIIKSEKQSYDDDIKTSNVTNVQNECKVTRKTEQDVKVIRDQDTRDVVKVTRTIEDQLPREPVPEIKEIHTTVTTTKIITEDEPIRSPTKSKPEVVPEVPSPTRSRPQERPQERPQKIEMVKSCKPDEKYKPSSPTDGQYSTTYRSEFTNKRISVDVSATHDAFARSLRSISPDRISDRPKSRGSVRTSTTSLRSSTSPEKHPQPSRMSPERKPGYDRRSPDKYPDQKRHTTSPTRPNEYSPERKSPERKHPRPDSITVTKTTEIRRKPSERKSPERFSSARTPTSPTKTDVTITKTTKVTRNQSPTKPAERTSPLRSPTKDIAPINTDTITRKKKIPNDGDERKSPVRSPSKTTTTEITVNTDTITRKKKVPEDDVCSPKKSTTVVTETTTVNTDTITRKKKKSPVDDEPEDVKPSERSPVRSPTKTTDTITKKKPETEPSSPKKPKGKITTETDETNIVTEVVTNKTRKPTSRDLSPTSLASDIEFINHNRHIVTDLDEPCEVPDKRPTSLEITETTVTTKKTKQVSESPKSPVKETPRQKSPSKSPTKDSPTKSTPVKEVPKKFKPSAPELDSPSERPPTNFTVPDEDFEQVCEVTPKERPPLKRTETYEERCRQMLGLPVPEDKIPKKDYDDMYAGMEPVEEPMFVKKHVTPLGPIGPEDELMYETVKKIHERRPEYPDDEIEPNIEDFIVTEKRDVVETEKKRKPSKVTGSPDRKSPEKQKPQKPKDDGTYTTEYTDEYYDKPGTEKPTNKKPVESKPTSEPKHKKPTPKASSPQRKSPEKKLPKDKEPTEGEYNTEYTDEYCERPEKPTGERVTTKVTTTTTVDKRTTTDKKSPERKPQQSKLPQKKRPEDMEFTTEYTDEYCETTDSKVTTRKPAGKKTEPTPKTNDIAPVRGIPSPTKRTPEKISPSKKPDESTDDEDTNNKIHRKSPSPVRRIPVLDRRSPSRDRESPSRGLPENITVTEYINEYSEDETRDDFINREKYDTDITLEVTRRSPTKLIDIEFDIENENTQDVHIRTHRIDTTVTDQDSKPRETSPRRQPQRAVPSDTMECTFRRTTTEEEQVTHSKKKPEEPKKKPQKPDDRKSPAKQLNRKDSVPKTTTTSKTITKKVSSSDIDIKRKEETPKKKLPTERIPKEKSPERYERPKARSPSPTCRTVSKTERNVTQVTRKTSNKDITLKKAPTKPVSSARTPSESPVRKPLHSSPATSPERKPSKPISKTSPTQPSSKHIVTKTISLTSRDVKPQPSSPVKPTPKSVTTVKTTKVSQPSSVTVTTVKTTKTTKKTIKPQKVDSDSSESDFEPEVVDVSRVDKKKVVTTANIKISNGVAKQPSPSRTPKEPNVTVPSYKRSTSSREPSPDKICPIPVSSEDEGSYPRYPDQVSEPDDLPSRRKPVKISDIPLTEEEDVKNFSRITEITETTRKPSPRITDIDKVTETDESLLSVTEKVSRFITTAEKLTEDEPKSKKPAPRVPRPELVVDETLEDDECLLSVSDKVTKFITTADHVATKPADRPKSPRPRERTPVDVKVNENDECLLSVNQKVSHFIQAAETVKQKPSPKEGPAPKVSRPNFTVDDTLKTDECLLSVSDKVSKFLTTAEKLTTDVKTSTIKREPSPEKIAPRREYSPEKTIPKREFSPEKVSPRRESIEKVTRTEITLKREPTPEKSRPEPKSRQSPVRRIPETCPQPSRPKSEPIKPAETKPVNLKSSEAVRKAKAMFENISKTQEVPKQRDILSRPSVWEGRKKPEVKPDDEDVKLTDIGVYKKKEPEVKKQLTYSSEDEETCRRISTNLKDVTLKSTKLILNENRYLSPEKDIPGYMKPIQKPFSILTTEVTVDKKIQRSRSPNPNGETPGYMKPLSKHSPEETDRPIHRSRSPNPNGEIPGYMKPIYKVSPEERDKYIIETRTRETLSPERDIPIHKKSVVEQREEIETHRTRHYENGDIPHYMLPLQRNISPDRERKPTNDDEIEIVETVIERHRTPERDVPGYMKPLQRHVHSPDREERRTSEDVIDDGPRAGKKFGVTLRRTDSGRMVQTTTTSTTVTERRRSSTPGQQVEDIQDLEVLERMMDKVVGYEQRRRIRAQIRVVKKLISENKIQKRSKQAPSPARDSSVSKSSPTQCSTGPHDRRSPVRDPKRSSVSPSKRTPETRQKSPEHKSSIDTKTSYSTVTTTTSQKVITQSSKDRSLSPEPKKRVQPPSSMYKPDLKHVQPASKIVQEDKPSWVTNRNLKKTTTETVTEKRVLSPKKVEVTLRRSPSPQKDLKPTDCITSSYGIGPTDENGQPLFGIRALRKATNDSKVHVRGTVVTSQYYSENGQEPVGEVTVTKYSNNPRELNIEDEEIKRSKGLASVTTTQKFGSRGTPTLSSIVDKKKAITDKQSEEEEIFKTTSTKVTRRGSVKALSQKFIENAAEISHNERQTYPKAGLILRTSSFKETSQTSNDRNSSRESSPGVQNRSEKITLDSMTSDSQQRSQSVQDTSSSKTKTFLNSHTRVTDAQDVITRMKNAENERYEGDSAEDREARMLLNKFLGAQVLMSGMEPLLSTKSGTVTTSSTSSSAQLVRKVQKTKTTTSTSTTNKETSKPLSLTKRFQTPITTEVLQDIWDEQTLRALLEQCTDYEERRAIRARLRQVMAEQEAVANVVASAVSESGDRSMQERIERSRKSFTEGPVTTTQVSTTRIIQARQQVSKPISPFAKFRQLDKQNSLNTPPSSPRTPTGTGAPLFKFTDPQLSHSASTVKDRLLHWCQMKTKEYQNIKLENFSTSWADGMAFCALIHHFLPDAFDYHALNPKQRRHNFTLAFKVADEQADIAPLLDVDDMVAMRRPDWKCVFTYVQSIYRRFKDED